MKNADQYVSDIQKSLQTLLQNIQPEMVLPPCVPQFRKLCSSRVFSGWLKQIIGQASPRVLPCFPPFQAVCFAAASEARNLSVLTDEELLQSMNIIRKVAEAAEQYAADKKENE